MKLDRRMPSAVAYLVILLLVLGLYRFTALGIDEWPTLVGGRPAPVGGRPAPESSHVEGPGSISPVALASARGSARHLLVPLRLDGHELWFLLDTGASSSVIDRRAAIALGLESDARPIVGAVNETWQVQQALPVTSLQVGGAAFTDFEMLVIDLAPIRASLGPEVSGVLGANVLGLQPFEIDMPLRQLWLGRPRADFEGARLAGQRDAELELIEMGGGYFVSAAAENREALFLLDTGASHSQIGESLASEVGTKSAGRGHSYDATGARVGTLVDARLASLVVGEVVLTGVDVSVGDLNIIGLDFLSAVHLRVEPAEKRLTLRYVPSPR